MLITPKLITGTPRRAVSAPSMHGFPSMHATLSSPAISPVHQFFYPSCDPCAADSDRCGGGGDAQPYHPQHFFVCFAVASALTVSMGQGNASARPGTPGPTAKSCATPEGSAAATGAARSTAAACATGTACAHFRPRFQCRGCCAAQGRRHSVKPRPQVARIPRVQSLALSSAQVDPATFPHPSQATSHVTVRARPSPCERRCSTAPDGRAGGHWAPACECHTHSARDIMASFCSRTSPSSPAPASVIGHGPACALGMAATHVGCQSAYRGEGNMRVWRNLEWQTLAQQKCAELCRGI